MPTYVATILGFIFAIAATVLAGIFIVPEKRAKTMNNFMYFVHKLVNFKFFFIELIFKFLYIFATAYVFLQGFFMLFCVEKSYYMGSTYMGGYGLLMMILGPIAVRVIYEFLMMAITAVNNIAAIRAKLTDGRDTQEQSHAAPAKPAHIPEYAFCSQCGTRYDKAAGGCPKCDK